jgi:hypothetical protein
MSYNKIKILTLEIKMESKANRSLYLFLCALMGSLLFMIVHRTIMLIYYIVLNDHFDALSFGLTFWQLNYLDFITMVAAMLGGVWYGIWLGQYWYAIVYEHGYFGGVVHHMLHEAGSARQKSIRQLRTHISTLEKEVAQEVFEIEDLAEAIEENPLVVEVPAKKRTVRKRVVKKV